MIRNQSLKTSPARVENTFPTFQIRLDWSLPNAPDPYVITAKEMAELPELSDLPAHYQTSHPSEYDLINKRWIAKLGRDLHGNSYTQTQRLDAIADIINILLKDDIIQQIGESIVAKLGSANSTEKCVYFPRQASGVHSIYLTNFLVAETKERVSQYIEEHYPESKIRISDDRVLLTAIKPNPKASRSTASNYDRLFLQGIYDVSAFKKDDCVFLLDDHVQYGGTLLSRMSALKQQGVTVIGAAALTRLPEMPSLKSNPELLQALAEALHMSAQIAKRPPNAVQEEFDEMIAAIGIARNNLTPREILMYIAVMLEPERNLFKQDCTMINTSLWFQTVLDAAGFRLVPERESDRLDKSFQKPAVSVRHMRLKMDKDIPAAIQREGATL